MTVDGIRDLHATVRVEVQEETVVAKQVGSFCVDIVELVEVDIDLIEEDVTRIRDAGVCEGERRQPAPWHCGAAKTWAERISRRNNGMIMIDRLN